MNESQDFGEDQQNQKNQTRGINDENISRENKEGILRRSTDTKTALQKIPTIGIIILILTSFTLFSLCIQIESDDEPDYDNIGNDTPSYLTGDLAISEVMPSEEWFELYYRGDSGYTLEGIMFTTFDEDFISIPTITGLTGFDYIVVDMGEGESNFNASYDTVSVYLDLEDEILREEGDELAIFDTDENIIDFMAWGTGNEATPREGWSEDMYPPAPGEGLSLSLHGPDLDSDSFWTVGPKSPGGSNIYDTPLSRDGDVRAYIINGRTKNVTFEGDEGRYTFRSIAVNVSVGVPEGHPVNQTVIEEVEGYVNYTYNLLRDRGYGNVLASETDDEGRPFVNITVTAGGTYTGGCNSNGEIDVDIGDNRAASKQVVEHEMVHNFQFSSNSLNPRPYWFIEEGIAEYWGRYSARENFNLTWQEVEEELQDSGSISIYNMSNSSWQNFFSDWPNTYPRPAYPQPDNYPDNYTANYTTYYSMAYLFMKFLVDEYDEDVLLAIHENNSGQQHLGIPLIERATGEDFPNLLRNFTLYRLENRFPQYENDSNFRNATIDRSHEFDGENPISVTDEPTERWGSRINEYIMNNNSGVLRFSPDENESRWQLTVIREYPNGTREYETERLDLGENGTIRIPPGYQRIIVIKTRLNGTEDHPVGLPDNIWPDGESFNITIQPDPDVNAEQPANNAHVTDDPVLLNFTVSKNFLNASVRLQVGDSSTFQNTVIDEVIWQSGESWSYPVTLENGTWWWRLRWEFNGLEGDWSDPTNFNLWKDPLSPEILHPAEGDVFSHGDDIDVHVDANESPENITIAHASLMDTDLNVIEMIELWHEDDSSIFYGTFHSPEVEEGTYIIEVTMEDNAGNVGKDQVEIEIVP